MATERPRTRVSRARAEKSDELRRVALEAAVEILHKQGWDAVTQANVAERSGIGRATAYRYWPERTVLVRDAVLTDLVPVPHANPTGDVRRDLGNELEYV